MHAPLVTRCVSNRPRASWHDSSLKSAKQERRRAERKWRSTGVEVHRQMYHQRKTEVRKLVTKLKKEYINERIEMSTSTKELAVQSIQWSSPAPNLPKHGLPDTFANYFQNKIGKLRESIDLLGSNLDSDPFQYDTAFQSQSLNQFEPVTEKKVRETILKCPPKSSEIDQITTSLLKQLIDEVVPVLTRLLNISLSSGIVPTAFKQAAIKPLLKKTTFDTIDHKVLLRIV